MQSDVIDSEMIEPSTALALISGETRELAINRSPDAVLEEAQIAAKALKGVIDAKAKKVVFNGKTYLESEDWSTIARFYGVAAKTVSVEPISFGEGEDEVYGFRARAVAISMRDGRELSGAESMCLNDEPSWAKKPRFQLASMAQTRAQSKALRHLFSWVVVLAGYAPTPAEEMVSDTPGLAPAPAVPMPTRKAPAAAPVVAAPAVTPRAPTADGGNLVTKVREVTSKSGEKNGKAWTLYIIETEEGTKFNTFDSKVADKFSAAANLQRPISFNYQSRVNGKFTNYDITEVVENDELFG